VDLEHIYVGKAGLYASMVLGVASRECLGSSGAQEDDQT